MSKEGISGILWAELNENMTSEHERYSWEELIDLNAVIKEKERPKINYLSIQPKKWGKEQKHNYLPHKKQKKENNDKGINWWNKKQLYIREYKKANIRFFEKINKFLKSKQDSRRRKSRQK